MASGEVTDYKIVRTAVFVVPLSAEESVTVVFDFTVAVVIANVPEVFPAKIVTDAGTVALVLPLDKVTTRPPAGAGLLICTVPTDDFPEPTEDGDNDREVRVGALIVRVPEEVTAANVPFIVADTFAPTGTVLIGKVTDVCPEATTTDVGTVADETLEASATVAPPGPAGPVNVTVPAAPAPPTRDRGATVTVDKLGGITVTVTDSVDVPIAPVIATDSVLETA